ncbi:MAG: trehalose-phosphatase [Thermoleophilia bacterium]|nr:trehalose-phosphatase [Thermoleophilia bacterium]
MEVPPIVARLAARPELAAIVLDVDGTLAPIVDRPEEARVPDETRRELQRLAGRYALVACVSGRAGADAARVVGVDGLRYVGAHGLELDPAAPAWRERLVHFAETVAWPVEDKGVTLSFHYRTSPDLAAARAFLEGVAERARAEEIDARFGRMVLELRPPLASDKGTAVRRLLDERRLRRALYAGDDTTDLDAFRALRDLELGVAVAVASAEMPDALAPAADLVVRGPAGVVELLRCL